MKFTTQHGAQAASDVCDIPIEELIKQTDHVGQKYVDGSPNNSPESTIPGMLEVLDYMLSKYNPPKSQKAA